MSAPSVSLLRFSRATDEGLSLLMDLFAVEPSTEARSGRPADWHRFELRARVQRWVRRAAAWGAGPEGAWRAW
ncbi:hypothetical protein E4P41_08000 [Geodermatophilus sp. DF01-2]|uniref:hypothetical protein n=1 Tax=Geodermatophilus sp. DF01-2 TaxID=2559610 RepID=UPI00107363ED|nr:hypothetical protein [Geodermatophilus sp. DF01_2]TFV62182.1 hypothetical protein E4P41_08000 [Geodermatophilus sp. DF01_2]